MLFHNPEVLSIHLKLLSLWKCLITGSHIIIVESGGIFIHNYTIIAIFEINMMIWLPKEYNIYRAECKVNIVFRSEVNSVDRKKKTRAIIFFCFVMNQRQIDTGIWNWVIRSENPVWSHNRANWEMRYFISRSIFCPL